MAAAGIDTMAAANVYLERVYRSAFNVEFSHPARESGTAFVPYLGADLRDTLCERFERTVGPDNCVRFEALKLQVPADTHRCHYVKAKVRVHRRGDGSLALFHGPRLLARFDAAGKPLAAEPIDEMKTALQRKRPPNTC